MLLRIGPHEGPDRGRLGYVRLEMKDLYGARQTVLFDVNLEHGRQGESTIGAALVSAAHAMKKKFFPDPMSKAEIESEIRKRLSES